MPTPLIIGGWKPPLLGSILGNSREKLFGTHPTLAEIDAFLADPSGERAYEKVVDRLLVSSAYGERMADDWLDCARYADTFGRDHHPRCFSMWFAGGGVKAGTTYGAPDDFGYNIAENPVHVHDCHATMMQVLGIDHERLTYKFQGLRMRLTGVAGKDVPGILA